MRGQLTAVLALSILGAIFALLNPDLLARAERMSVFGWPYEGPLVVVLLVLGPATWVLLLLIGAVAEWRLQRRVRALAGEVAARDREIVALKAVAYDVEHAPPPPDAGATGGTTAVPQ